MPSIEIRDLSFSYTDSPEGKKALDSVSLSIEDGEFLCVIGASGCGKSTLLRVLAGLEAPKGGKVFVGETEINGPGSERMIVFQDYALFPWMTAKKNISFAVRRARKVSKTEAENIAEDFLTKVNMDKSALLYPCQMSGGMKQRVAIARALAMDTDILLLDEPFGALDAKTRGQLQDLLLGLWLNDGKKKKTVVFVTHDITEAVLLADHVVYMTPARIKDELYIDLPRPRIEDESFQEYRERLLSLFEEGKEEKMNYEK